jgi:energy-coupling factor transporter transmembrane protein EcfT
MANRKGENPTGRKLAIASLFIGTVSLLTFTLMLVGALSGIVLGLASLFWTKGTPARSMSKVMAIAGILLSIAAFLPPYFYAAGNANAACTEKRLQSISAAEARYHKVSGRYGTLEELVGAGLLGTDLAAPVKCGYRIELESEGGAPEITAIPKVRLLTGRKTFRVKLPDDR